jgi:hypothetical protein
MRRKANDAAAFAPVHSVSERSSGRPSVFCKRVIKDFSQKEN